MFQQRRRRRRRQRRRRLHQQLEQAAADELNHLDENIRLNRQQLPPPAQAAVNDGDDTLEL